MSMRVYVGNLDYRTDDATLNEIFSEYGEVQSCSQVGAGGAGGAGAPLLQHMARCDVPMP